MSLKSYCYGVFTASRSLVHWHWFASIFALRVFQASCSEGLFCNCLNWPTQNGRPKIEVLLIFVGDKSRGKVKHPTPNCMQVKMSCASEERQEAQKKTCNLVKLAKTRTTQDWTDAPVQDEIWWTLYIEWYLFLGSFRLDTGWSGDVLFSPYCH